MLHGEVEVLRRSTFFSTAQPLNCSGVKKPGGKTKFSSRVEVWGCDFEKNFPKSLIKRRPLMPFSFLRFTLCCFPFFLSHRLLFPPFNPLSRKFVKSGMTSLTA